MNNSVENRFNQAGLSPVFFLTRRHEDLNIFLKVAIMGAESRKLHISSKVAPLWKLLRKKGVAWGTVPDWSDPSRNVNVFVDSSLQLGMAKAFSSFDKFLDDCSAELDRYSEYFGDEFNGAAGDQDSQNDEVNKLSRLYQRLSMSTTEVSYFFPFFIFYQELRNCIVHRAGVASNGSERAYTEIIDSGAISKWADKTNQHGPIQVTQPTADEDLKIGIPDVILSSGTLLIIARDISSQLCARIGVDGLTYLAARSVLRDIAKDQHSVWTKNKTFEGAVAIFLCKYNRLERVRSSDVRDILERIEFYRTGNRDFLNAKL